MSRAQLGVIGGSGFYQLDDLTDVEELNMDTPFGRPSGTIVLGRLGGVRLAFLSRHGLGHHILPTEVPVHANIWALKQLGVERIISMSAVGSLREEIEPQHVVVLDQLIDRTRTRRNTFFGDGLVAHIAFHEPFCPALRGLLLDTAGATDATWHNSGTCMVVEGPAFSTKAEAQLYRSWGAHVIGMTALPEAKLAREAEICYATLAMVTDYDTWHDVYEPVTADMIIASVMRNIQTGRQALASVVRALPSTRDCPCASALATALVTHESLVPAETKRRLAPIIGRYMPVEAAG
ncbi:MAG: S-methyl-5'-thioadenosine phosphorylase [Dehalococcoidia bacterium]